MTNFVAKSSSDDYSDLTELIDDDEQNEIFEKSIKHVRSTATTLDNKILLELYGLYKQSTEGPCTTSKPYFFDQKNKSKWNAWKQLGQMTKKDAITAYIELVHKIFPDFDTTNDTSGGNSWVRVSTMRPPTPEATSDCTDINNFSDLIRNEDLSEISLYLENNSDDQNKLDKNGMGLIHYAADIGNLTILELLIQHQLSIDLLDSDGQTALHYASSCGHKKCVEFLLNNNARTDIYDTDQCTAIDVAFEPSIKELFEKKILK